jgi:Cofactor assembly of complex C subunit B
MTDTALSSILVPTALLAIGLFFFIRSSTKKRLDRRTFRSSQTDEAIAMQLRQYLTERAYRVVGVDSQTGQVTFEGHVKASVGMAVFLTILAAIGLLCLAPIVSILAPQFSALAVGLVALSPLAGLFYWRNANRTEQICLKIQSVSIPPASAEDTPMQSQIAIQGHRDELAALQEALPLQRVED